MKRISRGYKKYLRKEKSRIRQEIIDPQEQQKLIGELYTGLAESKVKTKD